MNASPEAQRIFALATARVVQDVAALFQNVEAVLRP